MALDLEPREVTVGRRRLFPDGSFPWTFVEIPLESNSYENSKDRDGRRIESGDGWGDPWSDG